jgi:dihydrofolate synthase/folylpolyglutamate synthase
VVSVITPIHLEHSEVLGATLAAIAGEKAGIIKRQVPVVIARQAPEAQGVLERQALEVGAPLARMGTDFEADGGWRAARFRIGKERLGPVRLGLVGDHQVVNAAAALGCRPWLEKAGWRLPGAAVLEGLRSVCWPGRFECLGERGEWILDGAHNPDGIRALAGTVRDVLEGQPVRLVFGVLKEKDVGGMLPQLLPLASEVHLVRSSDARAREPAELLPLAGPGVHVHSTMEAALAGLYNTPGPAILVTGSLTVAGQARAWLIDKGLRPTAKLRT